MFWSSIVQAFADLTHWQVWVVLLGCAVVRILASIASGLLLSTSKPLLGIAWMFLFAPLLDFIALVAAYLILAPIIFGWASVAAWGFPLHAIQADYVVLMKFFGIEVLVLLTLGVLPLARISGVTELTTGAISVLCAAVLVARNTAGFTIGEIWPGWILFIGFLIVGVVVQFVAALSLGLSMQAISHDEDKQKLFGYLVGSPLVLLVSFMPTFAYAAWLSHQFAPAG